MLRQPEVLEAVVLKRHLLKTNAIAAEQRERERMGQYMQGLGQISQLQTNPEGIYTGMTNVGNTLASGQLAAAQAQQQGASNVLGPRHGRICRVRYPAQIKR